MHETFEIELEPVVCDICGCENYKRLFVTRDYRFGRKKEYSFVRCNDCGLIYLNPRPTQKASTQLYEEDYGIANDGPLSVNQGLRRCETLRRMWHLLNGNYTDQILAIANGKVLDIGCGSGKKFLLPLSRASFEVCGVEPNQRFDSVDEKQELNVFCGDLAAAKFPVDCFDTIIMSQVIEHLPSPKQTIMEIHRIVKPGGQLLIYCPNADGYLKNLFGKYWHGWHVPFHLYVFSAVTISRLADSTGFKVCNVGGVTPDDFFTTSLKSWLFGEDDRARPIDRGWWIDSLLFRALVAPLLRLLDHVLKGREDCLVVQLTKS